MAQSRLCAGGLASGGLRVLGRRQGVRGLDREEDRKALPSAVGGGVRVCSARPDLTWHVSTLLVRRRRKGSVPERQPKDAMSGTEARLTRLAISFVLDDGRRTANGLHHTYCRKHPPLRVGAEQEHLALGDPVS